MALNGDWFSTEVAGCRRLLIRGTAVLAAEAVSQLSCSDFVFFYCSPPQPVEVDEKEKNASHSNSNNEPYRLCFQGSRKNHKV